MTRTTLWRLLLGTAACGAMAAPALAQTPMSTAPAEREGGTLAEIVVMAQRRSENLQSVPVAVTAVTAASATAAGVTDTSSIAQLVPGFRFDRSANNGVMFLRGVGTTSGTTGNEPAVATFIDDVYILQNNATLFQFNNIESLAVLRGPQGTLFGRNATGGAIQIFTKDPGPTPQLDASIGYGNYDTITADIYGSTPLTDTLSVNLALHYSNQRDGWGKNINNGEDVFKAKDAGARLKIVWTPTDTTRIRLSLDASEAHDQVGTNMKPQPGTYIFGCSPPTAACRVGLDAYGGFYNSGSVQVREYTPGALAGTTISTFPGKLSDYYTTYQQGGSLKVEQELGPARFVSITAYRNTDFNFFYDQDGGPIMTSVTRSQNGDHNWTQEFQLLSADDAKFQWIVGGFYLHDIAELQPYENRGATRGGNTLVLTGRQKTTSKAAFGQVTTELFERTNVTVGLRYTTDKRAVEESFYSVTQPGVVVSRGTLAPQSDKWSKLTYRFSIDHKFNDDLMAYASYNRGFKSGVFNFLSPPGGAAPTTGAFQTPAPGPEVLDAFEVGFKSQLFDNSLRFNAAAYYYDYSNLQVSSVLSGVIRIVNAGAARIKGAEFEAAYAPSSNLSLNAALSIQEGEYTEFPNGPHNVPRTNTTPPSCANQPFEPSSIGGNVSASATGCNLKGKETVRTPPFSASLGGTYTVEAGGGELAFNAHLNYVSRFYWEPDNSAKSGATTLVNASLLWTSGNGRYDVRLWGKNLLGEKYYSYASSTGAGQMFSPAAPRTFGITFGTHWGG